MRIGNPIQRLARPVLSVPARLRTMLHKATARVNPAPVFVLGNQKNGTTAVAALLAGVSGGSVTLDIFFRFRAPVLARLLMQELTLAQFIAKNKYYFSTDIVKEPSLTFFYEPLRDCFPEAKFVFVQRDPRDNIRSILNRLRIPGDLAQLDDRYLKELPEGRGWRLILDGALFGSKGEGYIETLAKRWNLAADVASVHRDDVLLVRYEDFVADKAGVIAQIATTLGLDATRDISDKLDVQYQPRGNHSIPWLEFFGETNLRLIETVCRDRMQAYGYGVDTGSTKEP